MTERKTAVALGNFDGVHLGHIAVLKKALMFAEKANYLPVTFLFDCHPNEYFGKNLQLLTTYQQRNELIKSLGFEIQEVKFSEIQNMSPEEFVEKILKNKLNAGVVCCGYNYHFGKNSEGNSNNLKEICQKFNIEVEVCDKVEIDGVAVSSSKIRALIESGNISLANKMLGREFSFDSKVFYGSSNGKLMGFPTANQYIKKGLIMPKKGVYISSGVIDGEKYIGFTDIGTRPTFDDGEIRAETHFFEMDNDLYGKTIELELHHFLRDEMKFDSVDNLVEQLKKDKIRVIEYFKK
ncbi:MAG: bifunctional riboflavin kinase/FAD synthetase [Clostridia bacterium]|nr:bifunctional riboflavin kinase/FAD synthetase [Clostridia bacterium]